MLYILRVTWRGQGRKFTARIDPLNVALLTGLAKLTETNSLQTVWPALSPAEKTAILSDERALEQLMALHLADPQVVSIPARPAG